MTVKITLSSVHCFDATEGELIHEKLNIFPLSVNTYIDGYRYRYII